MLKHSFGALGDIVSVALKRPPDGQPPYAYINYRTLASGNKAAKAAHGADVFRTGAPLQAVCKAQAPQQQGAHGGGGGDGGGRGGGDASHSPPPGGRGGAEAAGYAIKVNNVPPGVTAEDLSAFMVRHLSKNQPPNALASAIHVVKDKSTGENKGFAYMNFNSQTFAVKAAGVLNGKDPFQTGTNLTAKISQNKAPAHAQPGQMGGAGQQPSPPKIQTGAPAGSITTVSGSVKRTITGLGPKYSVGDKIEAYYHDEGTWFKATVSKVRPDGTYDVHYPGYDDTETGKTEEDMRRPGGADDGDGDGDGDGGDDGGDDGADDGGGDGDKAGGSSYNLPADVPPPPAFGGGPPEPVRRQPPSSSSSSYKLPDDVPPPPAFGGGPPEPRKRSNAQSSIPADIPPPPSFAGGPGGGGGGARGGGGGGMGGGAAGMRMAKAKADRPQLQMSAKPSGGGGGGGGGGDEDEDGGDDGVCIGTCERMKAEREAIVDFNERLDHRFERLNSDYPELTLEVRYT